MHPTGTDSEGYQQMLAAGRQFPDRVWAVEGCAGIGRHIAQRLIADGEPVVDVPAKLSVRVRVFDTGQGRKTDPADAHRIVVAGLRSPGLRQVVADDTTVALRPEPVGVVETIRHRLAGELVEELTVIDAKIKVAKKQLHQLLVTTGTSLPELNGIGPSGRPG